MDPRGIVETLYREGEAVAGSDAAARLAEKLTQLLAESSGVEPRVIRLPVATWSDEGAVVECRGLSLRGATLPQTLGGATSGTLKQVHCIQPRCFSHIAPGDVVVARLPEDPDDVTTLYVAALERGASALIVYDRWPGRLRRIVVSGRWDYSLLPSPAPMPAVYLRAEDGLRLVRHCTGARVGIEAGARIERRQGRILEALIGEGDWEILVIAHYDHWLGGSGDNLAGVAALLHAVERLRGAVRGWSLRIAILDAEEFGDPQLPAWYWSYGSRWYAREMLDAGLLDRTLLVLNLDMPVVKRLQLGVTPEARRVVEAAAPPAIRLEPLEFETCYSDGYQFARLGVASATLYNIEDYVEYYHTDVDTPDKPDYEAVKAAAVTVAEVVLRVGQRGPAGLDYEGYVDTLYKLSSQLPLEARRAAYMVAEELRMAVRDGRFEAALGAARRLNRTLGYCVFRGDYRYDTGGFEPMLAPRTRIAVEEAGRVATRGFEPSAPGDTTIPGLEEHLAVAYPTPVKIWLMSGNRPPSGFEQVLEDALKAHVLDVARSLADALMDVYWGLRRTREL